MIHTFPVRVFVTSFSMAFTANNLRRVENYNCSSCHFIIGKGFIHHYT